MSKIDKIQENNLSKTDKIQGNVRLWLPFPENGCLSLKLVDRFGMVKLNLFTLFRTNP